MPAQVLHWYIDPLFHSSTLPLFHSSTLPLFHSAVSRFRECPSMQREPSPLALTAAILRGKSRLGGIREGMALGQRTWRAVTLEITGFGAQYPSTAAPMGWSSPPEQTLRRAVPLEDSGFGRHCPSSPAAVAGRVPQEQPFGPRNPSWAAALPGGIPPNQGLRRAPPIHCTGSGKPYTSIIHLHTIPTQSILAARTVCVSPPSPHILQPASRSMGCPSPITQAQLLPNPINTLGSSTHRHS
jgi:hypothetical protein